MLERQNAQSERNELVDRGNEDRDKNGEQDGEKRKEREERERLKEKRGSASLLL